MPSDAKDAEVIAEVVTIPAEDGLGRGFAVLTASPSDLALATIICCGSVSARPDTFGLIAAEAAHVLARAIAAARPEVAVLLKSTASQEIFGGLREPG